MVFDLIWIEPYCTEHEEDIAMEYAYTTEEGTQIWFCPKCGKEIRFTPPPLDQIIKVLGGSLECSVEDSEIEHGWHFSVSFPSSTEEDQDLIIEWHYETPPDASK